MDLPFVHRGSKEDDIMVDESPWCPSDRPKGPASPNRIILEQSSCLMLIFFHRLNRRCVSVTVEAVFALLQTPHWFSELRYYS